MLTCKPKFKNAKTELELLIAIFAEKGFPCQKTVSNYNSYPILSQIGSLMPKFPKQVEPNNFFDMPEEVKNDADNYTGLNGFINQLTALDPMRRPTAEKALELLKFIKYEYESKT